MKNKFLNSMALMTLFTLAQYAPMMAQSNDQAGKTAKKDKLEQRSQNKSDQSNDHTGADRFGRRGDSTRPHFGGKQSFQGRSFHGGDFKGPQNFRDSYMYRQGFKAGRFSQGYHGQRFENNFQGKGRRGNQWNRPGTGGNQFEGRGFQHQGAQGRGMRQPNPELKALKEQIWKDGVMDLKEKEMLQNKMKSFLSQRPDAMPHKQNEKLQKSPEEKK
ncbi:MAG: hypothetical protein IPI18_13170 [Saprospiraceae bacterium]|nr:hypothetical protein [Saprospiraceae bacterium]